MKDNNTLTITLTEQELSLLQTAIVCAIESNLIKKGKDRFVLADLLLDFVLVGPPCTTSTYRSSGCW